MSFLMEYGNNLLPIVQWTGTTDIPLYLFVDSVFFQLHHCCWHFCHFLFVLCCYNDTRSTASSMPESCDAWIMWHVTHVKLETCDTGGRKLWGFIWEWERTESKRWPFHDAGKHVRKQNLAIRLGIRISPPYLTPRLQHCLVVRSQKLRLHC